MKAPAYGSDEERLLHANPFWHLAHPMPVHATHQQRLAWRRAHARHCPCLPPLPPPAAAPKRRRRRAS